MRVSQVLGCALAVLVVTGSVLAQEGRITVGENVQASAVNASTSHSQSVMDIDPDNAQHLIACSQIYTPEPDHELSTVVYVSSDGGRGWVETLQVKGLHPSCAFGHGGLAYLTFIRDAWLYRSIDGGNTWTRSPGGAHTDDHPYLTVDNLSQAHANTIYISSFTLMTQYDKGMPLGSGIIVYRSTDQGKSLSEPTSVYSSEGHRVPGIGGSTVMADGTYVVMFPEMMKPDFPPAEEEKSGHVNAWIKVATSRDGGKTIGPASIVATTSLFGPDHIRSPYLQVAIAADTSSGPFRNRLYVVWQAKQFQRHRIWLSHSDDGGKTWSEPVATDDAAPRPNPLGGPNNLMPTVTVNKQGVVGVLWYDRRDNPDGLGWYARFTASLDGGDTFLPSVRVSTAPMSFSGRHHATYSEYFGKHVSDGVAAAVLYTTGFAAGPDGLFHAAWTDNRTGYSQLWTALITVSGTVLRNGSAALSNLVDVSSDARVHIGNAYWDWSSGEFECDLFVKNISSTPIAGPLKLRVLRLDSALGIVRETKMGPGAVEGGSVLDVSKDSLMPGQWSKPLHFVAHIDILFDSHDPDADQRLLHVFTIDYKTLAPIPSKK